jgi:hypothetical protein
MRRKGLVKLAGPFSFLRNMSNDMLKTILITLVIIYLVIGVIMLILFAFLYYILANDVIDKCGVDGIQDMIEERTDIGIYRQMAAESALNHIQQTHSIFTWLRISVLIIIGWPYTILYSFVEYFHH